MLFNNINLIELLLLVVVLYYIISTNILMLVYLGGLYLMLLALKLLVTDADIYAGFLLVIDLGVGLVFFIFILHFTPFLFQKSTIHLHNRSYTYLFLSSTIVTLLLKYNTVVNSNDICDISKNWFYKLTYLNYYEILNVNEVTELNLIFDSYFNLNSFEFFTINFNLLFGLLSSILLFFLVHKIFNFLNYSQLVDNNILYSLDNGFFIKNQNMVTQQTTLGSVSVWVKTKL